MGVNAHREEHLDLCAGYALGSLSGEDEARLEGHLASGCPACEAALADFSRATVLLGASAGSARPSPALRARVLEAAQSEGAAGRRETAPDRGRIIKVPRRSAGWLTWLPAAAAAAMAVVSALSWNDANHVRGDLAAERQKIADLQQQLDQERRWAAVLSAPQARVAELQITPDGLQALRARATYDPATKSAVIVFENFTAPEGKDYELWALRGAGVASLGVIKPDASGYAVLKLENVGDPETLGGFAVSLEPAGGSPNPAAPTGPVVMAGKFGG